MLKPARVGARFLVGRHRTHDYLRGTANHLERPLSASGLSQRQLYRLLCGAWKKSGRQDLSAHLDDLLMGKEGADRRVRRFRVHAADAVLGEWAKDRPRPSHDDVANQVESALYESLRLRVGDRQADQMLEATETRRRSLPGYGHVVAVLGPALVSGLAVSLDAAGKIGSRTTVGVVATAAVTASIAVVNALVARGVHTMQVYEQLRRLVDALLVPLVDRREWRPADRGIDAPLFAADLRSTLQGLADKGTMQGGEAANSPPWQRLAFNEEEIEEIDAALKEFRLSMTVLRLPAQWAAPRQLVAAVEAMRDRWIAAEKRPGGRSIEEDLETGRLLLDALVAGYSVAVEFERAIGQLLQDEAA